MPSQAIVSTLAAVSDDRIAEHVEYLQDGGIADLSEGYSTAQAYYRGEDDTIHVNTGSAGFVGSPEDAVRFAEAILAAVAVAGGVPS